MGNVNTYLAPIEGRVSRTALDRELDGYEREQMRLCGVTGPLPTKGILPSKQHMARRAERLAREQKRVDAQSRTPSGPEITMRLDWIEWALEKDWKHCEDDAREVALQTLIQNMKTWREKEGRAWEGLRGDPLPE